MLFGIDQPDTGEILIDGEDVRFDRRGRHAAASPTSRGPRGQSLVMDFSILDNATLPVLAKAALAGFYGTERAIDLVRTG